MTNTDDFTLDELLSLIKETFEFDENMNDTLRNLISKKDISETFVHQDKTYVVSNVKLCFQDDEFFVERKGELIFLFERQNKFLVSLEQKELLAFLGYRILERGNSSVRIIKIPCRFSHEQSLGYIIFGPSDGIRRYRMNFRRRGRSEPINQCWSVDDTIDELYYSDIPEDDLNRFLFHREQNMIRIALNEIQGELVAIVLNNILDQGQLLHYRGLI